MTPCCLSGPTTWRRGGRSRWARTLTIAGRVAEIWYPVAPDVAIESPKAYDPRIKLPASQQGVIPDDKTPIQDCDRRMDSPSTTDTGPTR